jgi:ectoine hydroxylase-related dioxygenase (phytanoyl-CoA dioxygenase family)
VRCRTPGRYASAVPVEAKPHTHFERDGWLIARKIVPPHEIAAMHELFTSIIAPDAAQRTLDGALCEITGAARAYPALAAIACDPRFGALAAAALGAERMQLLQDSLLYKPPHDGGSVEWHQDHTYVGFLVPARVIALRIALVAEDETNGCMRVIDGSHRWGPIGANRALRDPSVVSLAAELTDAQRAELEHPRSLVLEPGDISIHHCLTLHGSPVNRSSRPRRTIILRMFDSTCRLDATRLPPGAAEHFPLDPDGGLAVAAFPRTVA